MVLKEKIFSKEAVVGVIGLGYVGLPLAIEMAKEGYRVIGIDIDERKVKQLLQGESYIIDVAAEDVQNMIKNKKFLPTTDYAKVQEMDTVSICVPTPLRKTKDPDTSYITSSVAQIKKYMHKDILIILESTTYPGTTKELIGNELEEMGYQVGKDFYLCFSPERVDPGNQFYNTKNTPKVIGGATPACAELAMLLYGNVLENIVPVSSTEVAEMVKLLENTFRSVNIGLVNEIAMMCDRMKIDVWEVIDAASTKPFGFMPFYPGPGIGGHCIPLDPMYLSWKAKTYDFYNKFIELASDINGNMPRYAIQKVSEILNDHDKHIKGSKILILGMAYKANIDDLRESPGLEIYRLLEERGAFVEYHDPFATRFLNANEVVYSVDLTVESLQEYDLVILSTNHKSFNYEWISEHASLIFDTRNAFKSIADEKIYKLGSPKTNIEFQRMLREVASAKGGKHE